eukprot:gene8390-8574_t
MTSLSIAIIGAGAAPPASSCNSLRVLDDSTYVNPDEMDFEGQEWVLPEETEPKPVKREDKQAKYLEDDDEEFDLAMEDNLDDEDFDLEMEPVCRPESIHEYVLTPQSLYAAVSVGLDRETIVGVLEKLSKVKLTGKLKRFISNATKSYGKVKLVLKHNKFWVETADMEVLERLLDNSTIQASKAQDTPGADHRGLDLGYEEVEEEEDPERQVLAFEILASEVERVKKECLPGGPSGLDCPLLEEYDFSHDTTNRPLDISLLPGVQLRPYQEKSLSKISVSVDQWAHQFTLWTNLQPEDVVK